MALTVNGRRTTLHVAPHRTLLEALREELGLVGTKVGCDVGTCGACTVLVDGRATYSCMTLAIACEGRAVDTVESLSQGTALHPLQMAFIEQDAYQCGFCTSGQLMSLVGLLRANPAPTRAEIERAVVGNLCRCGAYPAIVSAALAVAEAGNA